MYRGWTKIDYQDMHCITDQTDKGTYDDRGRDGRTNFTWRIKEQVTRLTPFFEHDDDDDDDDDVYMSLHVANITADSKSCGLFHITCEVQKRVLRMRSSCSIGTARWPPA
jgi:hypothetical protein